MGKKDNKSSHKQGKVCVFCGTTLLSKSESKQYKNNHKRCPDNGETKDHIPQKCLYEGYPSDYKTNRFTVPACHKCNSEFSKYEPELRDLIGVANNNISDNLYKHFFSIRKSSTSDMYSCIDFMMQR
jgi:hypothetical protein